MHHFSGNDFSSKTLKALTKRGIRIVGATYIPGPDGSFISADAQQVWNLDDNGTHRVRTFREVMALAA